MRWHWVINVFAVSIFSSFGSQLTDQWRAEHRLLDLHMHIDGTPEHLARAVRIMDASGIGIGVNLSGGTTTSKDGKPSAFEQNKALEVS